MQGVAARQSEPGLFDDIVGLGKFVLLSKEGLGNHLSDRARTNLEFVDGIPVSLLEDVVDVDGTYGLWLDHFGAACVLVRPDFYVFGSIGSSEKVDELVLELGRQLSLPQ